MALPSARLLPLPLSALPLFERIGVPFGNIPAGSQIFCRAE
jgi:hypothetical protein